MQRCARGPCADHTPLSTRRPLRNAARRAQGGNNAGHTIVVGQQKFDFHLVPSGLLNPNAVNVIGNGVVVHLPGLFDELDKLKHKGRTLAPGPGPPRGARSHPDRLAMASVAHVRAHTTALAFWVAGLDWDGRVFLSDRAHLVLDYHQAVDGLKEAERGSGSLGTTRKGIGPTYSSKASRSGLRVHDLANFEQFSARYRTNLGNKVKRFGNFGHDGEAELAKLKSLYERAKPMIADTVYLVNRAIADGKRVLVEGANAVMLDLDFGTASPCTAGGSAFASLAMRPWLVRAWGAHRHVPVCDVVVGVGRRCVHRPGHPPARHRRGLRRRQGIHDSRWRRPVPDGAAECASVPVLAPGLRATRQGDGATCVSAHARLPAALLPSA